MPSPNTITAFYVFSPRDLLRSSYINNNFSMIRGNILPIDASTAAFSNNNYSLGSEDYAFKQSFSNVLVMSSQSTPANPSTGKYKIYPKADGNYYILNASGTESRINTPSGTVTDGGVTATTLAYSAVNGQVDLTTTVASDDEVLLGDTSASALKKASVANVILAGAASQAEQESASVTNRAVTPGRQHYHPSAAKAWCSLNGQGTIAIIASYNVSGITDNGSGSYTITLDTDMSSANYCVSMAVMTEGTQNIIGYMGNGTMGVGSVVINTHRRDTGAAIDVPHVDVVFFGDQ